MPSHFKHGEKNVSGCILCEHRHKHKLSHFEGGRYEEKKSVIQAMQRVETQSNVPNAPSLIDTSEF